VSDFYHVCFTVPDLDAAMRDLTAAAAVRWSEPQEGTLDGWPYRIVFTQGGAPFIELIETAPGGPWGDTSTPGFHHLGWWTSDIKAGTDRLTRNGFPQTFNGCPYGRPFAYHRLDSIGGHIELVAADRQPDFISTWSHDAEPMPAIKEETYPWGP
jgi:catechol 2,3-dioxygenase-like lactoylglutathione lyase family enzyme